MVSINNHSQVIDRKGKDQYFRWKVFVDEPDSKLAEIVEVEYTLHPTFPAPHQVRTSRAEKFALETQGWGEFTMLVDVRFRDGSSETVPYHLDLKKGWPTEV